MTNQEAFGDYVNSLPSATGLNLTDTLYVRQGGTSKQIPASAVVPSISMSTFGSGDGTTDNHLAYLAALAALPNGSGTIIFGPGTWVTSSAYDVPSGVSIAGDGPGITFLKGPPAGQPAPLGYTLTAYATFNGTGSHGISGITTYAINTPTSGANTVTTTTSSDASHFSAGTIIALSGGLHSTNFWFPYWTTTVLSADPSTGIITLTEQLPFGGSDVSLVQNIVNRPHDITISNLTILGSGVGCVQANTTLNLTFDNVETSGTAAAGNNHAYFSIAGSRNVNVRNSKFVNYVDFLGCFDSSFTNNVINQGQLSIDGGTQNSVFSGNSITDPANNGSPASGIVIVSDSTKNRVLGNNLTNIPPGFSGINVGQSNDNTEGSNILGNNTITGTDTTVTGIIIGTSDGNVLCGNLINTASIGVRLSSGATNTLFAGMKFLNVATPYVVDPAASVVLPTDPVQWTNQSAVGATPTIGFGYVNIFNASAQNITNFLGGGNGQSLYLKFGDGNSTLIQNASLLNLRGASNYNPPASTLMHLVNIAGIWWEVAREQSGVSPEIFTRGIIVSGVGSFSQGVLVSPVAIASLPASPVSGQRAIVNNGVASPTFLGTVSTTGSTVAPVMWNGSNWVYC